MLKYKVHRFIRLTPKWVRYTDESLVHSSGRSCASVVTNNVSNDGPDK
jgi:hypothetical protein